MYRCAKCNQATVSEPGEVCMRCRQISGQGTQWGVRNADSGSDYGLFPEQMPTDIPKRPSISPGGRQAGGESDSPFGSLPDSDYRPGPPAPARSDQAAALAGSGDCLTGVISNYRESTDPAGPVLRWIRSMMSWLPFRVGSERRTFLLYAGGGKGRGDCRGVEMQGKIAAGQLYDNLEVSVIGRPRGNGTIFASKIIIHSTGETVAPFLSLHPMLVWFLPLAFLAGLILSIASLLSFVQANSGTLLLLLGAILAIILLVAAASVFFRSRRRRGRLWLILFGIAFVLLVISFMPQLIAPLLVIGLAVFLLTRLFARK